MLAKLFSISLVFIFFLEVLLIFSKYLAKLESISYLGDYNYCNFILLGSVFKVSAWSIELTYRGELFKRSNSFIIKLSKY